jgi:hypothetical protein
MSADNLKSIIKRIRAMRAKASNDASSEAEAEAAAGRAAKLMAEYDLAESDLGSDQERDEVAYATASGGKTLHPVDRGTAMAIAKLTETEVWQSDGRLNFAGMPMDLEMAIYLVEMLRSAAERGWMGGYADQPMTGRMAVGDFRDGFYLAFASHVSQRIMDLAREREAARATSTGTDLMITKRGLITTKLKEDGLRLKTRKTKQRSGSHAGRDAGQAAAGKVGFGRPITSTSSGTRQLT